MWYLLFVLIALTVFGIGIGTVGLIKWAIKQPSLIKVVAAILFALAFIFAIGWGLAEFSN